MYITHIALWTENPKSMRDFYVRFFGGVSGAEYINEAKGFSSYFISFPQGPSLEIMARKDIAIKEPKEILGFCHIAFKLGSEEKVLEYTDFLAKQGVKVVSAPRRTGDGYFESVIEDPEGNKVELVA